MEGPKIKYYCDKCKHLKFMYNYYYCLKMNSGYIVNLKKETPEWCVFLPKIIRKEKLKNLNNEYRR